MPVFSYIRVEANFLAVWLEGADFNSLFNVIADELHFTANLYPVVSLVG
jgi:hypothetical protein